MRTGIRTNADVDPCHVPARSVPNHRHRSPALWRVRSTSLGLALSWTLVSMTMACQSEQPRGADDPAAAAKIFVRASYVGAGETLFGMITPKDQQALTERSRKINDDAGAQIVEPADLLVAQGFLPRHVKTVERLDEMSTDDSASIRVTSHLGATYTVPMVRVDGSWRVQLNLVNEGTDGT